jgi:hypothetical protein
MPPLDFNPATPFDDLTLALSVKGARSALRRVPEYARNAHWQMARRAVGHAALLTGKNNAAATNHILRAQYHLQVINCWPEH